MLGQCGTCTQHNSIHSQIDWRLQAPQKGAGKDIIDLFDSPPMRRPTRICPGMPDDQYATDFGHLILNMCVKLP